MERGRSPGLPHRCEEITHGYLCAFLRLLLRHLGPEARFGHGIETPSYQASDC
jgi:hypothetical protein